MSQLSQQGRVDVHARFWPPLPVSARSWASGALQRLRGRPSRPARRSAYRTPAVAVLAAAIVALVTAGGAAASPHHYSCGHLRPRAKLHCAWLALHQARSGERWIRHHGGTAGRHSLGYWRWRERVALRWTRSARYRISHPPIKHLRLWVCIHGHEGAWNDPNSGGNGHYGGLQMSDPWSVYGRVLVTRADYLSPYAQMRAAETGWEMVVARQGYSYARYTWLPGQWNHPDCMGYA